MLAEIVTIISHDDGGITTRNRYSIHKKTRLFILTIGQQSRIEDSSHMHFF